MKRGTTGGYRQITAGGESYRAFVPTALPPEPPLDLGNERQRKLERATLALGRLDSITLLLPDPGLFLYAYVRREAVLSSMIEGTQSSLSDLLLFEMEGAPGVPFEDVIEVSNYVAALNHGMKRLSEGFPLCNRLIREMHAVLLSKGRGSDKTPGEFRRSQNWIGGTRPGNALFVPPPSDRVEECMAGLERFLHDEGNTFTALTKAALAHVQFETIHPFPDGNGRIGRLLIAYILHHEGVLSEPLLYLSLFFKEHRGEYYRLIGVVRSEGDWEAWLDFFLEGVEETAQDAVQTAQRLVAVFQEDEGRVRAQGRPASTALRVFSSLRERPLTSLNEVSSRTGLSFPASSKGMDLLVNIGVAREITGQRRNRLFAYDRYLAILSEGMEP